VLFRRLREAVEGRHRRQRQWRKWGGGGHGRDKPPAEVQGVLAPGAGLELTGESTRGMEGSLGAGA
jgi:hypothetical protein